LPTGKCVGGTTTINSGTSMRTPEHVLDRWEVELGLPRRDLEKYFPQVEDMLNSRPVPKELQGTISDILLESEEARKLRPRVLARADQGCDGQGLCVLGCPTGAKRSTDISFMAEALKHNAFLFSHYRVEEIIVEDGKAKGV